MILHITDESSWQRALREGHLRPESLAREGFIHCSTAAQVAATANLYFAGQKNLLLLCIDETRARARIVYEPPTCGARDPAHGALFPHLYGPLNVDAVIRVVPFPAGADGRFTLPAEVES